MGIEPDFCTAKIRDGQSCFLLHSTHSHIFVFPHTTYYLLITVYSNLSPCLCFATVLQYLQSTVFSSDDTTRISPISTSLSTRQSLHSLPLDSSKDLTSRMLILWRPKAITRAGLSHNHRIFRPPHSRRYASTIYYCDKWYVLSVLITPRTDTQICKKIYITTWYEYRYYFCRHFFFIFARSQTRGCNSRRN